MKKEDKMLLKNKKKTPHKLRQQDIKKYSRTELDHVILKIKEKELQYTIFSVIVVVFVILISGYVIFSSVQKTRSSNTLRSGNLLVDYKDTIYGFGDTVTINEVKSLSDKEGMALNNYQIKLTNNTLKDINYIVKLIYDDKMIELDECKNKQMLLDDIKYSVNGKDSAILKESEEGIIYKAKLPAKGREVLDISVWVSDAYLGNKDRHFHGRFVVEETREVKPSLESMGDINGSN